MRAGILLIFTVAAIAGQAVEVDPISIRVEQISGNASNRFKHSQSKALKVHISNGSAADVPGLRVKYFYFGRSLKGGEISILKQGESKANVASHDSITVEVPDIESAYTEEHGKRVGGKGGRGAPRPQKNVRYKDVEATGTKLIGYGVQVFFANKLVAESFSEPGLKSNVK